MATVSRTESSPRAKGDGLFGPVRRRLSVDDYYRMAEVGILDRGARVELIDGEIIDMSPIGVVHAALVNVLVRYLSQHFGDSTFVSSQNPLQLDHENEVEPDLTLLRPRSDCYCTAHPTAADTLLVIEVADTSLAYDLDVKVPLYARFGVPEVRVIEAATRRTQLFRGPQAMPHGSVGYAESQLIEAGGPLPLSALRGAAGTQPAISLMQLLPVRP